MTKYIIIPVERIGRQQGKLHTLKIGRILAKYTTIKDFPINKKDGRTIRYKKPTDVEIIAVKGESIIIRDDRKSFRVNGIDEENKWYDFLIEMGKHIRAEDDDTAKLIFEVME